MGHYLEELSTDAGCHDRGFKTSFEVGAADRPFTQNCTRFVLNNLGVFISPCSAGDHPESSTPLMSCGTLVRRPGAAVHHCIRSAAARMKPTTPGVCVCVPAYLHFLAFTWRFAKYLFVHRSSTRSNTSQKHRQCNRASSQSMSMRCVHPLHPHTQTDTHHLKVLAGWLKIFFAFAAHPWQSVLWSPQEQWHVGRNPAHSKCSYIWVLLTRSSKLIGCYDNKRERGWVWFP